MHGLEKRRLTGFGHAFPELFSGFHTYSIWFVALPIPEFILTTPSSPSTPFSVFLLHTQVILLISKSCPHLTPFASLTSHAAFSPHLQQRRLHHTLRRLNPSRRNIHAFHGLCLLPPLHHANDPAPHIPLGRLTPRIHNRTPNSHSLGLLQMGT